MIARSPLTTSSEIVTRSSGIAPDCSCDTNASNVLGPNCGVFTFGAGVNPRRAVPCCFVAVAIMELNLSLRFVLTVNANADYTFLRPTENNGAHYMTFRFRVNAKVLEVEFESGSVKEGLAILENEKTALGAIF